MASLSERGKELLAEMLGKPAPAKKKPKLSQMKSEEVTQKVMEYLSPDAESDSLAPVQDQAYSAPVKKPKDRLAKITLP